MLTPPTLDDAKAHLNITGTDDDGLVQAKLDAAHAYVASHMPADAPDNPALAEATLQLAAHLFENREAVGFDLQSIPEGIFELIGPHRAWAF